MDIWTKAIPELFRNLKALGCVLAECQPRSQGLQGHGAVSTEAACPPAPAPPPRGPQQAGREGLPTAQGRAVGAAMYVLLKDSGKITPFQLCLNFDKQAEKCA